MRYNKPPLPFMGNKRNMLRHIKKVLETMREDGQIDSETIFIDCFGGSGLISHNIKQWYPSNRVIWNDYDNYQERLKGELESIITNYKDDFSTQWEAQKFRDRAMGSEKVDSMLKSTQNAVSLENKGHRSALADVSLEKAQGQNLDLFSIFVENDRIKESALNHYAKKLPKTLNEQEFLAQIPHKDKQGYSTIQTPIGQIQVNLQHAWNHLHKGNTYKKDRSLYSGAFLDTLADPLFIVKQEYTPSPKVSANAKEMQNSKLVQTRDAKSIAQDSYVFFKPYKIKDKYTYMVGYALDIQGNIINTTFIPMTSRDFGRIKKMFSSQVLYAKL